VVEWIRDLVLREGCVVKSHSMSGTIVIEIIDCGGKGVYEVVILPGERIEFTRLGYGEQDRPETLVGVPVN